MGIWAIQRLVGWPAYGKVGVLSFTSLVLIHPPTLEGGSFG